MGGEFGPVDRMAVKARFFCESLLAQPPFGSQCSNASADRSALGEHCLGWVGWHVATLTRP